MSRRKKVLAGVVAIAASILVVTIAFNLYPGTECEPSLEQFPGKNCLGPIGILDAFHSAQSAQCELMPLVSLDYLLRSHFVL